MDKRISRTIKLIEDAFFELIQEKEVSEITVKEICAKAQISRSTFYDHYEDYFSFLKSINGQIVENLVSCTQLYHFDTDTDLAVHALLNFMTEKRGLFSVVFHDSNNEAIRLYIEKMKPIVVPVWLRESNLVKEEADFIYDYFMNCSMWLLKKWFYGEINVSDERFKEMFESLTKYGIYQYIYTK